jgi:type IV secretory pathway TrbD component
MDTQPLCRNSSVTISTSNAIACDKVMIGYKRTQVIITNTSAAAVATVSKGSVAAVAGAGIRLPPNASYLESSDSGFRCWQGEIQVIADAAGTVAVVEQLEPTGG